MAHEFRDGVCVTCNLPEAAFNESMGMSVKCEPGLYQVAVPPEVVVADGDASLAAFKGVLRDSPLPHSWTAKDAADAMYVALASAKPVPQCCQCKRHIMSDRNKTGKFSIRSGVPLSRHLTVAGLSKPICVECDRMDTKPKFSMQDNMRRWRVYTLSNDCFMKLFGLGRQDVCYPEFPELPSDAVLLDVRFDDWRRAVEVRVWSSAFEVVPDGARAPEFGMLQRVELRAERQTCALCKKAIGKDVGDAVIDDRGRPQPLHPKCAEVLAALKNESAETSAWYYGWAADFDPLLLAQGLLAVGREMNARAALELRRRELSPLMNDPKTVREFLKAIVRMRVLYFDSTTRTYTCEVLDPRRWQLVGEDQLEAAPDGE